MKKTFCPKVLRPEQDDPQHPCVLKSQFVGSNPEVVSGLPT